MRKNLVMFVVLCFVVLMLQTTGAFAEVPMCRLGVNPVDTTRDISWGSQCVLTLTTPQVVRMESRSGEISTCKLATGTSVVIDKETGRAQYVRFCSNPLLGHPMLEGQRDCAPPETERLVVQNEVSKPAISPSPSVTIKILSNGQEVTKVKKHTEVTVVWESVNADQCDALSGVGFNTRGSANGSERVMLNEVGTYLYDIQCHGSGGYVVAEAPIMVKKSPIWPWVVGFVFGVAIIGLSGGGGHHSTSVRPGPTIP